MDSHANGGFHVEDDRESSSQYTAASSSPGPSTPGHSTPGRSELGNSSQHELQHASYLSDDSLSSALRVDVRKQSFS